MRQPLAFEIGGDRHVLEHRRKLMPNLLGEGGFHLGADQHLDLLCADGHGFAPSLLINGRIVPR
jgi:hypothetical protein